MIPPRRIRIAHSGTEFARLPGRGTGTVKNLLIKTIELVPEILSFYGTLFSDKAGYRTHTVRRSIYTSSSTELSCLYCSIYSSEIGNIPQVLFCSSFSTDADVKSYLDSPNPRPWVLPKAISWP